MKMKERKLIRGLGWLILVSVTLLGIQGATSAYAEYPDRPIINLRKAGPGSMVDRLDQLISKMAPEYLGVDMPVLYKKGCSGCNAQTYVQKQPADGYHVFLDTTTTAIVLGVGDVPYTEKDWNMIIRLQVDPQGLASRTDAPWKNLNEMVDWARKNPGKLRVAGAHAVGIEPYTAMRFAEVAGIDITYVPYEGGNEIITMLLGKHVDVGVLSGGEVEQQWQAGKLQVLGIGHTERLEKYPDWPTFKEQGVDVQIYNWRGVFVKAGTSPTIINKLHNAFNAMRKDPQVVEFNKAAGQIDGYMGGPEQTNAFFEDEVRGYRKYFGKKK